MSGMWNGCMLCGKEPFVEAATGTRATSLTTKLSAVNGLSNMTF